MSENSNFNAIFGGVVPSATINRKYGSFRSEQSQGIVIPLNPSIIDLEITDLSDGVSVSNGTISFTTTGKYILEATILFKNNELILANSGYVWIRKNGANVLESRRLITLYESIDINVLTLSYLFDVTLDSDTIELYFTTTSVDMAIYYDGVIITGLPNCSSVICNVFQIA